MHKLLPALTGSITSAIALSMVSNSIASAATWTNPTTGGVWSNAGNWADGIVADGAGATADFSTLDILANNTVSVEASHTLGTLKFGDADSGTPFNWILSGSAVTFDNSGSAGVVDVGAGITTSFGSTTLNTGSGTGLDKTGGGTFDVSGGLTGSGIFTVKAGTVTLNNSSGSTSFTGSYQVDAGATLQQGNGAGGAGNLYNGAFPGSKFVFLNGGTFRIARPASATTTNLSAAIVGTGTVRLVGGNAGVGQSGMGIIGDAAQLILESGTATLSLINTYTGGTIINAGILVASNSKALGSGDVKVGVSGGASRVQLTNGVNVPNALIMNANSGTTGRGVLEVSAPSSSATWSGPITINASPTAGGHFYTDATSTLTLTGGITSSVPVGQRLGNVVLSGGGSYSAYSVSGNLKIGATDGVVTSATLTVGSSAAGVFDLNGFDQTLAGLTKGPNAASVTNTGASPSTLTLNVAGASIYAGTLDLGTGSLALTKSGAGTLTLTGANTYTGATTVNDGTLLVNGSISGSSTTVSIGGAIGGSGSLGTLTVNAGGNVNPGNSLGILSTGNLTLAGALNADITGVTAGSLYDQLNVTGTVDLSGSTLSLSLGAFIPGDGNLFFLITNDLNDPVTGTFAGLANGALFMLGGQQWQVSYFGDSDTNAFTGGNDVALMAVPEPNSCISLVGGLGMVMGLRRRRK